MSDVADWYQPSPNTVVIQMADGEFVGLIDEECWEFLKIAPKRRA